MEWVVGASWIDERGRLGIESLLRSHNWESQLGEACVLSVEKDRHLAAAAAARRLRRALTANRLIVPALRMKAKALKKAVLLRSVQSAHG